VKLLNIPYLVRRKKSQAWRCTLVIPFTSEVEAGDHVFEAKVGKGKQDPISKTK
jgi:hypothetical protein